MNKIWGPGNQLRLSYRAVFTCTTHSFTLLPCLLSHASCPTSHLGLHTLQLPLPTLVIVPLRNTHGWPGLGLPPPLPCGTSIFLTWDSQCFPLNNLCVMELRQQLILPGLFPLSSGPVPLCFTTTSLTDNNPSPNCHYSLRTTCILSVLNSTFGIPIFIYFIPH